LQPIPEYERLFEVAKQMFMIIDFDAHRLRSLPAKLQGSAVQLQLNRYWLPMLQQCFGSLERFLFYFLSSTSGHNAFIEVSKTGTKLFFMLFLIFLSEGIVDEAATDMMWKFARKAIKKWRDKVQTVYEEQSVLGLYGTFMSERYIFLIVKILINFIIEATLKPIKCLLWKQMNKEQNMNQKENIASHLLFNLQ
jgi:hypothetical protein